MFRRSLPFCLLFALCLRAGPSLAAEPAAITLAPQPDIARQIAAFPRIVAPRQPQTERINHALAEADARVREAAKECRAQAQQSGASGQDADWQRNVSVAMRGPRYLALVASDDWDCGGAYPNATQFALAYDLETGAPLNWQRLLPKPLVQNATLDTAGDGTKLGVVVSPKLKALYLHSPAIDKDCHDPLRDSDLEFMLWPDAEHNGVAMQPSNLPHVIAACGVTVVLPQATLHQLGVAPDLLDAIAAAHQAGLYGAHASGH